MQVAEAKKRPVANNLLQAKRQPFFAKEGEGSFFSKSDEGTVSFFNTTGNRSKYITSTDDNGTIQRQEQPDTTITAEASPNSEASAERGPEGGSSRASGCYTSPEFPNFRCLAYALKLDIDENLWNNAHHFYRVASLHPGDNQLMWNTFLRYGLGVNLLKTSFGFLGANETWGNVLSYGTGIGLKSFEFFQNGVLQLDVPIPLGRGINLDLRLDLNSDPQDLGNVRSVNTGIGISSHF